MPPTRAFTMTPAAGALLVWIALPILTAFAEQPSNLQSEGERPLKEAAAPQPPKALTVIALGADPFVVKENDVFRGLSVDVWQTTAQQASLAYRLEGADSVEEAIERVNAQQADLVIGPISITAERAGRVTFTQPYFQSNLRIAAPAEAESAWSRVAPFFSGAFLAGAGALIFVLLIVGTLTWVVERKRNEDFPAQAVPGIANGLWMALVTMTTVGYGDRVPVTPWGRVVAGIWMLIAMLTASSLTAFFATAMTLSQIGQAGITGAGDLRGERVAVVEGSTAIEFVRRYSGRPVKTSSLEEAVGTVRDEKAVAVVFDGPMLQYYLNEHPQVDLTLLDATYEPQGYGFVLALGSDLATPINVALLELAEDQRLDGIARKWLGGS